MKKETIGENAGTIWRMLLYKGSRATMEEIMDSTGLNALDASAAIGWLAREDKVQFFRDGEEDYFDIEREMYY